MKRSILFIMAAVIAGCSGNHPTTAIPDGDLFQPEFSLTAFGSPAGNPWFPLTPGVTRIYEGESDGETERIVVEVTHHTREVMGVLCRVVRDRVYVDGELVEDTYDWFSTDSEGNVWYFGEDSKEIEDGVVVSTAGSWEAGVDGALPGIIMPAHPRVGMKYSQERAPGVAEDMAQVKSLDADVLVAAGDYEGCLETMEWTPLDPGHRELKYYAPGVGLVLETPPGGHEPIGLVSISS
jgi:hypothetical protein